MKKSVQRLVLGFSFAAQMLAYQNCAKVDATDITSDGTNAIIQNIPPAELPPTCTDGKDITKPTKIFLVVDASASNYTDPAGRWIGTDDNKAWRTKVLSSVIARYGKNPHISFGLVSFQGSTPGKEITVHIQDPVSKQAIFTNDMAVVQAGVDDFMKVVEGPDTPYPAAVASAHDAIQADLDAHPGENATYEIVMLTDGVPSKNAYDTDRHPDALAVAAKDTQAIIDLSPGMIHFNGVYYYNDKNLPKEGNDAVLKTIVNTGQGLFLTANTQPEYDFNIDTVLKFDPVQCE